MDMNRGKIAKARTGSLWWSGIKIEREWRDLRKAARLQKERMGPLFNPTDERHRHSVDPRGGITWRDELRGNIGSVVR